MGRGNELRRRWSTPTGQERAKEAVLAIATGRPLSRLGWLQRHEGHWDLRGLPVAATQMEAGLPLWYRVAMGLLGGGTLLRSRLASADLSYSDLRGMSFAGCLLTSVTFDYALMRCSDIMGCRLTNCSFIGTDLFDAKFRGQHLGRSNEFQNCLFERANLGYTSHGTEHYRGCTFANIGCGHLDFCGARFVDCRFLGRLHDVLFHGHDWSLDGPAIGQARDAHEMPNRLLRTDFTASELRSVGFYGVDLTTSAFPSDGNHLVMYRPGRTASQVVSHLVQTSDEAFAAEAVAYCEALWLSEQHARNGRRDQPVDVVNRLDLHDFMGEEHGDRLYDLLARFGGAPHSVEPVAR